MKKLNLLAALVGLLILASCATAPTKKTVDLLAINPNHPVVFPETYVVHRVSEKKAAKLLRAAWEDEDWEEAETLTLANFRPESSFFYVTIKGRLLHDGKCIYAIFHTENDRFVYATHFQNNTDVCTDNCVEFFFQPQGADWYANCEFSLSGAYLTQFHPDKMNPYINECYLAPEHQAMVETYNTMRRIIAPEITEMQDWSLTFNLPMAAIEPYAGPIGDLSGQRFLANFYHCADFSSHPRWVSWAPLPYLSFHLPECFSEIVFE